MGIANLRVVVDNTQKEFDEKNKWVVTRHDIFDGRAEIHQTVTSGGFWHFRMWVAEERKYVRKSLRTKHLDTAILRAEDEYHNVRSQLKNSKAIFSPTLTKAVEQYLEFRQKDVERGAIVPNRLSTIKTMLNNFVRYVGSNPSSKSRVIRLSDLDKKCLYGYQKFRQNEDIKNVTIRNELAMFNALCKFCFEEGLHDTAYWNYPKITTRGVEIDELRRATYTDAEYKRVTKALRLYTSKKLATAQRLDATDVFIRQVIRHYFLIGANTMMRVGELKQLTWNNVETFNSEGQRLARITVRAETSKVRKSRVIVVRGGEHFDRLKRLTEEFFTADATRPQLFNVIEFDIDSLNVFCNEKSTPITADTMYWHYPQVMKLAKIDDWKERNLTYYSLRHFGITKRLQANVNPLTLSKVCGTSLKHLTETYYHADETEMLRGALERYEGDITEAI